MDETPRITELRKKLEKDPGSRLFAQLAEELRKEGRFDEAIEEARAGLQRHPNYPSARLTLARALMDAGRPAEARPELEQVVKGAPDNILAGRLLGEALEELGDRSEALKQFEQTLRFSPGDKPLAQKIADLKSSLASPPPARPAEAAQPALPLPTEAPAVPLPSVFSPAPVSVPVLPSVMDEAPAAVVAPAVPTPQDASPASPTPQAELPAVPVPAGAPAPLDRDLASGTFSPGTLTVPADLRERFETSGGEEFEPAPLPRPSERLESAPAQEDGEAAVGAETIGFAPPPATIDAPEAPSAAGLNLNELKDLPSVETPSDEGEVGATTLPLNSVTLADLYLQQGLKAEASAVLAQVMKDEPENQEARSKFEAVSSELPPSGGAAEGTAEASTVPAGAPSKPPEAPKPPAALSDGPPIPASPRPTRAQIRDRSVASLKAFLGAVEREAVQQKATEQGAFR